MKILIIEDEKLPREGLYKILKNKYNGIQILTPQINGTEGLKCIEIEKPEIILTDISMPDINGLEMLSKISKTNYNPYIIILSGYSKFEFAQKALSLGVKKYVLKPFKVNDIIEYIDTAISEVSLSNCHLNEIKLIDETNNNQYCSKLLIRYKKNYELCEIIKKIVSYFGKYLGSSVIINHSIDKKMQTILFKIYYSNKKQEDSFPTKEEISHRLSLSLNNKVVGFLMKSDELNDKNFVLNDLLYAHCFFNLPNIAYITDIIFNNSSSFIFRDIEKNISQSILDKNSDACISNLNNWLNEKINQQILPSIIYKDLKNYLYRIHNQLINNSSNSNIETFLLNIKDCFTLQQLKSQLNNFFIFPKIESKTKQLNIDNPLIKQTLTLIDNNIFCPIYLEEISVQLNVSTEHLSRLFKEELKIGFNQYVNKMKIELAKEYFKKDTFKVSEVSKKLGFSTPRYFSKVFKKITGMTCKEYRKHISI